MGVWGGVGEEEYAQWGGVGWEEDVYQQVIIGFSLTSVVKIVLQVFVTNHIQHNLIKHFYTQKQFYSSIETNGWKVASSMVIYQTQESMFLQISKH